MSVNLELKTHPEWSGSTQKLVAQIILLDQFTRNSFRNDAKMYAGDGVCLDLAREILKTRADRDLAYVYDGLFCCCWRI